MNTQQIAEQLVEWFNAGEIMKPYTELYSPNIISVEQQEPNKRCEGMDQLMKKGEWWHENFKVHSASASVPLVAKDWFTVVFTMDTTHTPSGYRCEEKEVAVYKVKDGKIVYEEFFYTAPEKA